MLDINFKGKDVLSIREFGKDEIEYIFKVADKMEPIARRTKKSKALEGNVMATLFYQPSTRTRLSFESAMQRLGGSVIGFASPEVASVKKGEDFPDTIRTVENYCDIMVIRHFQDFAPKAAADLTEVPVINAGDGMNEHPTQTLLELYTIKRELGHLDDLKVMTIGPISVSRTHKPFILAMAYYGAEMVFATPEGFEIPDPLLHEVQDKYGCKTRSMYVNNRDEMSRAIRDVDVVRIIAVSKESFGPEDHEKLKGTYRLDLDLLGGVKRNMIILHPLPRVDEIAREVDTTPYAAYFRSVRYGLFIRMALLSLILDVIT
jgi:aspartate carbamoyltransferase catalytic subunit